MSSRSVRRVVFGVFIVSAYAILLTGCSSICKNQKDVTAHPAAQYVLVVKEAKVPLYGVMVPATMDGSIAILGHGLMNASGTLRYPIPCDVIFVKNGVVVGFEEIASDDTRGIIRTFVGDVTSEKAVIVVANGGTVKNYHLSLGQKACVKKQ